MLKVLKVRDEDTIIPAETDDELLFLTEVLMWDAPLHSAQDNVPQEGLPGSKQLELALAG